MKKRRLLLFIILTSTTSLLRSQAGLPDINFGSVKAEDFSPAAYAIDSNATAVFLFDVGSAYFHEPDNSRYEIVMQRHTRIRILDKKAFDLATLALSLNKGDDEETVSHLQAAVYNLKDGKVVAQQIDDASIFTEKSKRENTIKLTLPNVVVGSIIEFSYIINRPGINLPSWSFQGEYPRLWSRFEVVIPYFFNFAVLKQGDLPFVLDSTSTFHTDYVHTFYSEGKDNTLQHTWAVKNMPGVASEPFVRTMDNYVSKIGFQLSAYQNSYGNYIGVNQNWASTCIALQNDPAFFYEQESDEHILNATTKKITGEDTGQIEKAKDIYEYVRDNFNCIYHYGKWRTRVIKEALQTKKGTAGDLNLLLYSLLNRAGLEVHPVILSTTNNGTINYEYPVMSQYNYVICQLVVNKKQYFLDASCKYLPFGSLNDYCYNGYSRVIAPPLSQGISISPGSLTDSIVTEINVKAGEGKAEIVTALSTQPTIECKTLLDDDGKMENGELLKSVLDNETTVPGVKAKGLGSADSCLSFSYEMPVESFTDDVVYFSPFLSLQMKSNPFSAANRVHDIELPFRRKDVFRITIDVPEGYEIEELPKPAIVKADSILSEFSYRIGVEKNTIYLFAETTLGKAFFQPEEYPMLRKFYSDILKKEDEQIVFKKKK